MIESITVTVCAHCAADIDTALDDHVTAGDDFATTGAIQSGYGNCWVCDEIGIDCAIWTCNVVAG